MAVGEAVNINVHGYVTAMPCEIENKNYIVDLKKINIWNIKESQKSPWVDFSIKLKNCPLETKDVIITLSGTVDSTNTSYFINTGTAKNVALDLVSGANKSPVKNGTQLTIPINSVTRSVEIPFSARVVGYGSGMAAGSFRSHLELTLFHH